MKPKQQLTRAIATALFAVILLAISPALFAQVKIGTNPTVIGANNNLEVEASTMGNKMSIDKTTGKVTIADASQGVDKVLTSDANGVATWQKAGTANIAQLPKGKIAGAAGSLSLLDNGVAQDLVFPTLSFSESGVTQVGSGLKVPVDGYYRINALTSFYTSAGCTGTAFLSTGLGIKVNNVNSVLGTDTQASPMFYDPFNIRTDGIVKLNANDIVTCFAIVGIGFPQAGCTVSVSAGELSVVYQP